MRLPAASLRVNDPAYRSPRSAGTGTVCSAAGAAVTVSSGEGAAVEGEGAGLDVECGRSGRFGLMLATSGTAQPARSVAPAIRPTTVAVTRRARGEAPGVSDGARNNGG